MPPQLEQLASDFDEYLAACVAIDRDSPELCSLANKLARGEDTATAKACFEWVRDNIEHSSDFQRNPVTCSASDALHHGTGYCYSKSHLLCALLRANGIPAGLCYQRLSIGDNGAPYCLHGLVAIWLPEYGWYRVDPRGNREGIAAEFSPPAERLAFSTDLPGEHDLPGIYPRPLPLVEEALRSYSRWDELYGNLPDDPGG